MTNEQPEQWAVKEIETVTGDFLTETGAPFYRIEIDGYCADFDYRDSAENFAAAIQRAFAEREAELVGALNGIYIYANDTLSGRADGPDDRKWQRDGIVEIRNRAREFATVQSAVDALAALKSREAGHG